MKNTIISAQKVINQVFGTCVGKTTCINMFHAIGTHLKHSHTHNIHTPRGKAVKRKNHLRATTHKLFKVIKAENERGSSLGYTLSLATHKVVQ